MNDHLEKFIMKKMLATLSCAVALSLSTAVGAAVLTFDSPSLIDIDPASNVATYREAGFTITGAAASYLPIDNVGARGTGGLVILADGRVKLTSSDGGLFTLNSFDYGLFDSGDSGALNVNGLLSDNRQLNSTLPLGGVKNFAFQGWTGLREVNLIANTDFVIDNVNAVSGAGNPGGGGGGNAVPEPGTLALMGVAAAGLIGARKRHCHQANNYQ